MGRQTITKEVEAILCDFCDKEVDTKSKDYCYHSLVVNGGDVIDAHKYGVKHFFFGWWRKDKTLAKADEYVRYDFHAECFDNLMRKFH